MDRIDLFKRIADYLFASYRWGCMNSPAGLEPKPLGLAVDLLEYQRLNHPVYRQFCEHHGRTSKGASIFDYPPLPVGYFEKSDFCAFPESLIAADFHRVSKNTVQKHQFRDVGLLQRSSIYAFTLLVTRAMQPKVRVFSMLPACENAPHSMLAFRFSSFVDLFGTEGSSHFGTDEGIDAPALIDALLKASQDNVPVHLMGTSQSCRVLLDKLQDLTISSAAGSSIQLSDDAACSMPDTSALRNALHQKLGIAFERIYSELSLIELSSQGYEISALNTPGEIPSEKLYVFPNWLKCFVFNPENGSPVLPGNPGKVAFFDLCNLDSVAFILTGQDGELCQLSEGLRARVPGHPKFALKLLGRS